MKKTTHTPIALFAHLFPALRSGPTAVSGAFRQKQIHGNKTPLPLAALAGIVLTCSLHAQNNGTWNVDDDGNWNDGANWLDSIIAAGSGSTAFFTTDITDDRTVTLGENQIIGNITFTDSGTSSHDLTISGANILTLAGATPTVSVTQAGRMLTIASEIAGNSGLTKAGAGSLTLSGSAVNTFTGGLNVNGGALVLDYGNLATPTNLIGFGNALTLGGGSSLAFTGQDSATDTEQTFSGTTLGLGKNSLTLAKGASATSATLNLGDLTVDPGSVTMVFTGTAGSTTWTTGNTPNSEIINATSIAGKTLPTTSGPADWINVNAGLFYRQSTNNGSARWVSVDDLGQFGPIPAGISAIAADTDDARLAFQLANAANIELAASTNPTIYGLLANAGNSGGILATPDDGTLTLNGIIKANFGLNTINPGAGTSNLVIGAERNLVINMDHGGGLVINAPIADNGGGASSVTVTSTHPAGTPGNVTLASANTYTGHTYINAATLVINNNSALGTTDSGTTIIGSPLGTTTGTTLQLGGSALTISEAIHISGNANGRARIFNAANVAHVLNGPIDITSTTGNPQIWNNSGSITINGDITGTLAGTVFFLRGNSTSADNRVLGSLNFSGNFFKTEDGVWTIGAPGKTYSWGTTNISRGTLRMSETGVLPSTTVVSLGQNDGFAAVLDLDGFSQTVAGIQLSPTPGTGTRTITSATDATLTVGDANDYTYGGAITGDLALNKVGAGTQTLSGANTYTEGTTVTAGTLTLDGSLADASMTIDGGNVNGTGTLTFNIDGSTFDQVVMSSGSFDVTDMTLRIPAAANLTEPEYLLVNTTGGSFIGTFATFDDAADSGYTLDYSTANQVKLVAPGGGNDYQSWADDNNITGGPEGDSNNNGVPNLIEYALADGAERGTFSGNTITFTKRGAPFGGDITYIIETSTTMQPGSWSPAVTHGPDQLGSPISYIFNPSPGTPKEFARLRVTMP